MHAAVDKGDVRAGAANVKIVIGHVVAAVLGLRAATDHDRHFLERQVLRLFPTHAAAGSLDQQDHPLPLLRQVAPLHRRAASPGGLWANNGEETGCVGRERLPPARIARTTEVTTPQRGIEPRVLRHRHRTVVGAVPRLRKLVLTVQLGAVEVRKQERPPAMRGLPAGIGHVRRGKAAVLLVVFMQRQRQAFQVVGAGGTAAGPGTGGEERQGEQTGAEREQEQDLGRGDDAGPLSLEDHCHRDERGGNDDAPRGPTRGHCAPHHDEHQKDRP